MNTSDGRCQRTVHLREAIAAYRAALDVFDAKRAVSFSERTGGNLTVAEALLRERLEGAADSAHDRKNP